MNIVFTIDVDLKKNKNKDLIPTELKRKKCCNVNKSYCDSSKKRKDNNKKPTKTKQKTKQQQKTKQTVIPENCCVCLSLFPHACLILRFLLRGRKDVC